MKFSVFLYILTGSVYSLFVSGKVDEFFILVFLVVGNGLHLTNVFHCCGLKPFWWVTTNQKKINLKWAPHQSNRLYILEIIEAFINHDIQINLINLDWIFTMFFEYLLLLSNKHMKLLSYASPHLFTKFFALVTKYLSWNGKWQIVSVEIWSI